MANRRETLRTLISAFVVGALDFVPRARAANTVVLSPQNFSAAAGSQDDTAAVLACDSACVARDAVLDGLGRTYTIASPITLKSGRLRNIQFMPAPGYRGAAPTFLTDPVSGVCTFESVSGMNFVGGGANIRRSEFGGVHTFRTRGKCVWNNNGNKVQTVTKAAVETRSEYVLPVTSVVGFAVGDRVFIGDSGVTISEIDSSPGAQRLVLVSDGMGAKLNSSIHFSHPAGQFVTKDANGKNGITVGDGKTAFSLDIAHGSLETLNNAWFGFFSWNHAYDGKQYVYGLTSTDNGFINIGLGYLNEGEVSDCLALRGGNNGIDTFEAKRAVSIRNNVSRQNGVDGLFVGSNGEIAAVLGNDLRENKHFGTNLFSRITPTDGMRYDDNDCRDNYIRSVSTTGIRSGSMARCKFGGSNTDWSVWIEGSNKGWDVGRITLDHCAFYPSEGGKDIGGNVGGFGKQAIKGRVDLLAPNFLGRKPVVKIYNADPASLLGQA